MTHTLRKRLGLAVAGMPICIAAAACSSGSGDGSSNAHALPPNDKATIERVFVPALDRLGVRLTRGARVDLQTGKPSAKGKHLAVYAKPDVRPMSFYQDAVVKANIVGSAGTSSPTPTSPSYDR